MQKMEKEVPQGSSRFERPIDDLLFDQRKGRFLTPDEKERIKKYAKANRLENQRKKNEKRTK